MADKLLQEIMFQAPFGYAYHKLVCNKEGTPENYIFLNINPAFEKITGLRKENILGKKVTEVLPDIKEDSFDWIKFYGHIALNGGKEVFTQYSVTLQRWYKVTAYSWQKGYFITYVQDVTEEMKQIKILEKQQETIAQLTLEMEKVFNGTNDAMFLVQVEEGQFRYLQTNKAHQERTGFSLAMIRDKTPVEMFGKKLGKVMEANYRQCLEAREPITYEEILDLPGGKKFGLLV